MINFYSLPNEQLPMSMRALRVVLRERGWKAEKLTPDRPNDLILTRPDGREIRIASSTPPTTSVFALHLADNKLASYSLLSHFGVPQPETLALNSPEDARSLLEKYGTIVIKPADGAHGRGVTTGIKSLEQVGPALEKAVEFSAAMKVAIAQPQLPPDDIELRIICIGYKFVEAIARIPAQVTGDGQHTIIELVDLENASMRTEPYRSDLAYIDRDAALSFLGDHQSEIPAAGERVRVVASCNVGQGGTVRDYSDKFTPEMRKLAEKIAQVAQLPVIGIDFYGDQVIEFNACPMLYYPTGDDAATKAVVAYVDYLAQL